jgi:hypothetical protein
VKKVKHFIENLKLGLDTFLELGYNVLRSQPTNNLLPRGSHERSE